MRSRARAGGGAAAGSTSASTAGAAAGRSGSDSRKLAPEPGVPEATRSPPISRASWRLMAKPRPVPPWVRAMLASLWSNGVNSRAIWSSSRPGPVSRTWQRTCPSWVDRVRVTEPVSVNLMALENRLLRIWRSRVGSPSTQRGRRAAPSSRSLRPFLPASTDQNRTAWQIRARWS